MSLTPLAARRLDVALAREQATGRLPSVVAGVVRDGALEWTGAISVLDGFETGPDVQYRIGSITKTLVAVLVLQLRDEGVLDLNDPLSKHLPGVAFGDRTLRDLLAHATGMSAPSRPGRGGSAVPVGSFDELAAALDEATAPFEAGETFHYTNVAFALLGEVVARHRGTLVVGCRAGADPGAAGHDADELPAGGAARVGAERAPLRGHADSRAGLRRGRDGAGGPGVEHGHRPGALRRRSCWRGTATCCHGHAGGDEHAAVRCAARRRWSPRTGSGFQLSRTASGMAFGHTGSMPGFLARLVRRPRPTYRCGGDGERDRRSARRDPHAGDARHPRATSRATVPRPWRPSRRRAARGRGGPRGLALGQHRLRVLAGTVREVLATGRLDNGTVRSHTASRRDADGTFVRARPATTTASG